MNGRQLTSLDRIELSRLERFLPIDWNRIPTTPYVSGIEITQSIQYYRASAHLTDAADRGPDNSLGLAASKPAWVRVYVRSGFFNGGATVTGALVVERQTSVLPILWTTVATHAPESPGSVVAEQSMDYATERGSLAASLNFVLPADEVYGKLRLRAIIWGAGASQASPSDTDEIHVDATLQQTLRVRGIFVRYTGPNAAGTVANMNLSAPTVADLQASCGNTLTVYPVQSVGVYSSGGTITWSTPLTGLATQPGGCSQQWLDLNVAIAAAKANDGNRTDVLYVGLLPTGVPIANVGGCNSSGVSAVPNAAQWTMAHELGHAAGLSHAPCGTPGDANYPAYEPYDPANMPTASLGEYGLDINDGTIHPPTEKDWMSYCSPVWISLYHFGRLYNNAALDPQTVGLPSRPHIPILVDPWLWPWEYIPDPGPWELPSHFVRVTVQPVISLVGIVDLTGEISVSSVMRVRAVGKLREGTPTALVAELVGKTGEVVARAPILKTDAHGHGCSCGGGDAHGGEGSETGYAFHAMLPDLEPGTALRIVRVDPEGAERDERRVEVWSRTPAGPPPRVRRVVAKLEKREVRLRWEVASNAGDRLTCSIQFSKDRGKSWNGLATDIRGGEYRTAVADLPSGTVVFRVLAHDGFHTGTGDAKALRLPARPPALAIVHPYDGRRYRAGVRIRLCASVATHIGAHNPKLEVEWQIDGKRAGRGLECWILAPKPGKHTCRVVARDDGGASEATAKFVTE